MPTQRCVLIADDDRDIRDALRFLLEDEGYVVAEAANGAAALAWLRAAAHPAVVLLDQVMPRPTGTEVLGAIARDTAILARTRFVILTARHEPFSVDETALLTQLGVVHVHKPFDVEAVAAVVRQTFDTLPPGGASSA